MMEIKARSFARAGFLGNPSDGYFGKTISFTFREFGVDLTLRESEKMTFVPGEVDDARFDSPEQLVRDVRLYGYYGGIRMLKATAKVFFEYCMEHGIVLASRNFTAEYKINIPRLVGLSGSSAICSAMFKALKRFYGVEIPEELGPTLVMAAEKDELGIACGLQDRVAQMYNGLVFMDFERSLVESAGHGRYERLYPVPGSTGADSRAFLPNLYVAYDPTRAEESGKAHKQVKRLFEQRNSDVLAAMSEFADIAQQGREILLARFADRLAGRSVASCDAKLSKLINANFDLRDRIFNVAEENRRMVMTARSTGASAKFAGSGGAIVGTFEDDAQFARLSEALSGIGCRAFRPTVANTEDEDSDLVDVGKWRNS